MGMKITNDEKQCLSVLVLLYIISKSTMHYNFYEIKIMIGVLIYIDIVVPMASGGSGKSLSFGRPVGVGAGFGLAPTSTKCNHQLILDPHLQTCAPETIKPWKYINTKHLFSTVIFPHPLLLVYFMVQLF